MRRERRRRHPRSARHRPPPPAPRTGERGGRARRVRGGAVGRLVPAYDARDVRAGLPRRAARPPPCAAGGAADTRVTSSPPPHHQQEPGRKGGPYQQPVDVSVELLPLTVPEIRHVLWALAQPIPPKPADQVLAWSDARAA